MQPWSVIDAFDDPNDCLDTWVSLFDKVVNDHAPLKEKRASHKRRPDWWIDEIYEGCHKEIK